MRRLLAPLALTLFAVPALTAQDKTAAPSAALVGTWTFDASRSDSQPATPGQGGPAGPGGAAGAAAAVGGAPTGGGGGGGRGRGRGGGGGGGGGGEGAGQGLGMRGGGARMNDPKMRGLMAEARPAASLVFTAADPEVTIADANGHIQAWRADGRKHQEAQMEGGVIEFEAKWKGKTFVVERSIPEGASLRREFKPSDDGKTLEVKAVFEMAGRKVERKYVYTRQ